MARNMVFGLLVAGLMIGVPGVVGEDDDEERPSPEVLAWAEGIVEDVLGITDVVCIDYKYGRFTMEDLHILPDESNIQSRQIHLELPIFTSMTLQDYLDRFVGPISGINIDSPAPGPLNKLETGTLLIVDGGHGASSKTCIDI